MQKDFIDASQFCSSHQVNLSILQEMEQYELVKLTTIEETSFISSEQLPEVEKMIRLYLELGVNLEGLDVIRHLLKRLESLQDETVNLRNQLKWYEEDHHV